MSVQPNRVIASLVLTLVVAWSAVAQAAPKPELWDFWSDHSAESTAVVDHSAWSDWLQRYVRVRRDGANQVAYGSVSKVDRDRLDGYIDALTQRDPRELNRLEQKAYWINLYNALTVRLIVQAYPVDSIRKIKSGFFSSGPWDKAVATVAGQSLTLNDIEHRILRPIWKDPLIHYGVNCASIGCPDLRSRAYTGARVDAQLAENARAFVNDQRGARIDNGELAVSSIYVWFQVDFGASEKGVIRHLQQYAEPGLKDALNQMDEIHDDDYDWSLNDAP